MCTLEEILHPVTPAQFRADYEGCQPLHIPAAEGSDKRALLTWDAFNGLLNQSNVWDSEHLKLMRHDDAVPPEQYCRRTRTPEGLIWRPAPAEVEVCRPAPASWPMADGGVLLETRLSELATRLAGIVASPAFRDEVALLQRRLMPRARHFTLPVRKPATLYRVTGRAFPDMGSMARRAYDWMIEERQFAVEDLIADMDSLSETDIRSALAGAEQADAVQRV